MSKLKFPCSWCLVTTTCTVKDACMCDLLLDVNSNKCRKYLKDRICPDCGNKLPHVYDQVVECSKCKHRFRKKLNNYQRLYYKNKVHYNKKGAIVLV